MAGFKIDKDYKQEAVKSGWDIELDFSELDNEPSYIELPEGDYEFTVTKFDRSEFKGTAKVPQCQTAELTVEVKTDQGIGVVRQTFFLLKTRDIPGNERKWNPMKAMLMFLRSIGHDGVKQIPWDDVVGRTGKAHIAPHKYNDKTYNEIQRFLY